MGPVGELKFHFLFEKARSADEDQGQDDGGTSTTPLFCDEEEEDEEVDDETEEYDNDDDDDIDEGEEIDDEEEEEEVDDDDEEEEIEDETEEEEADDDDDESSETRKRKGQKRRNSAKGSNKRKGSEESSSNGSNNKGKRKGQNKSNEENDDDDDSEAGNKRNRKKPKDKSDEEEVKEEQPSNGRRNNKGKRKGQNRDSDEEMRNKGLRRGQNNGRRRNDDGSEEEEEEFQKRKRNKRMTRNRKNRPRNRNRKKNKKRNQTGSGCVTQLEALSNDNQIKWVEEQVPLQRSLRSFSGVYSDPSYAKQWYINGQADGGFDMGVKAAWTRGVTGQNAVVAIIDDGVDKNHPDLRSAFDQAASYDFNEEDSDPISQWSHGTRCAGIIASQPGNSVCTAGIAHGAKIGGIKLLDGVVTDALEARALSFNRDHIDVYTNSWGPLDNGLTMDGPRRLTSQTLIDGVMEGRNGKGSIFVWASGNGGRYYDSCSCDGYSNSAYTISITAVTQQGNKPFYTEGCSSLLAAAFSGGESTEPKISTTDSNGGCTDDMSGTSASAPMASAIIAMALEVNPDLTWRDVQNLIVLTSSPGPTQNHASWKTNAVGRRFSDVFGFGLMNAAAMIDLAQRWNSSSNANYAQCEHSVQSPAIEPNADPDSISASMIVNDACVSTVEHVQLRVNIDYEERGKVELILRSPSGTESKLLHKRSRDRFQDTAGFAKWNFTSVHFWGESAKGKWILKANAPNIRSIGNLFEWTIVFHGDKVNVNPRSDQETEATTKAGVTGSTKSPVNSSTTPTTAAPSKQPSNNNQQCGKICNLGHQIDCNTCHCAADSCRRWRADPNAPETCCLCPSSASSLRQLLRKLANCTLTSLFSMFAAKTPAISIG